MLVIKCKSFLERVAHLCESNRLFKKHGIYPALLHLSGRVALNIITCFHFIDNCIFPIRICRQAITLFYFNKTEADIWCRKQLDEIVAENTIFRVKHVLSGSNLADSWPERGHISSERVTAIRDSKSDTYATFCFVCGPVAFNETCLKLLQDAGYELDNLHIFHG